MTISNLFVVMGVSGSGKTSVAEKLAEITGGKYLDADDFHSPAAKAKMSSGQSLIDEDRWPWLDRLNAELQAAAGRSKPLFLACSALKQRYRDRLAAGVPGLRFVYLKGSFELFHERMMARKGHFMPASLLASQFEQLEEPTDALVLDMSHTIDQLADDFLRLTQAGA